MKKLITILAILAALVSAPAASAQSAADILGGLLGGGKQKTDTTAVSGGSGSNSGSGIGDLLGGIAGALGIGNKANTAENLAGVWSYKGPAVTFKSDNFLLKAGGEAASIAVEKKIEPYYQKAGLTNLELTMNPDSTFTMKAKRAALNGTYTIGEDGNIVFNFQVLKAINIGKMNAYVKLSGKDKMALTFDVSKLITIIEKVGSVLGNSSIKTLTSILTQYDGMTAGFDLKKTAEAPATATTGK